MDADCRKGNHNWTTDIHTGSTECTRCPATK